MIALKIVGTLCLTLVALSAIGSFGPRKVKKVRTITERAAQSGIFDREVNLAIDEGWRLKQIVVNRGADGATHLIAFLEK